MDVKQTWTIFKDMLADKVLSLQYYFDGRDYKIWAMEGNVRYCCDIRKVEQAPADSDQKDFEDNYMSDANKPMSVSDEEGRTYVRAESKPTDMTTYFTSNGDSETQIGGGISLTFNFNNTDDEIDAPSGFRQKLVKCTFIDTVRLKEGTIYWENMPFGSHIDLCLGVPNGGFYYKNDGTLAQNITGDDLMIAKFVNNSPMMGSAPMGDELNTETSSFDIPAGTIFGFHVTVPSSVGLTDNCHGAVQMELYRVRTVILE